MNKTIKAILRGYFIFDVNGKRFITYNSAIKYSKSIKDIELVFLGWNINKGWNQFHKRNKRME